jgi:cbb3-type cytochrome oxidase subunit 3
MLHLFDSWVILWLLILFEIIRALFIFLLPILLIIYKKNKKKNNNNILLITFKNNK